MRPVPRPSPWRTPVRIALLLSLAAGGSAGVAGTAAALRAPAPATTSVAGAWVEADGVRLRLERIVVEQAVAHTTSGSASGASTTGADQPAEGKERVSLEVTLQAVSRDVTYRPADLTLGATGGEAVAPLRYRMGEGTLQPGRSTSARLTYEVPADAASLVLSYRGLRVTFDGPRAGAVDHGGAPGPGSDGEHGGEHDDAAPPAPGGTDDHHGPGPVTEHGH